MRWVAACGSVALALLTSACDPRDRTYFSEGVGTSLYTSETVDAVAAQDAYLDALCGTSGCATPMELVQTGMNDIDRRCDAYLSWLDARRRDKEPILTEIGAVGSATSAIMLASGVGVTPIGIVAQAFGLATQTYSNWNSRLLLEVDHSTVQTVVYTRQTDFRNTIAMQSVPDRARAIYLLRNYLRICLPLTIETDINTSVKLAQLGAGAAVPANPVVQTAMPPGPAQLGPSRSNPRGGVVIRNPIGTDDARKILTQYVYPNGVLKPRDKAHEQDVKDFMKEQNIRGPVSFFIDSGGFASQRAELVSRLKARGAIP
jgi:hypothetical protein